MDPLADNVGKSGSLMIRSGKDGCDLIVPMNETGRSQKSQDLRDGRGKNEFNTEQLTY